MTKPTWERTGPGTSPLKQLLQPPPFLLHLLQARTRRPRLKPHSARKPVLMKRPVNGPQLRRFNRHGEESKHILTLTMHAQVCACQRNERRSRQHLGQSPFPRPSLDDRFVHVCFVQLQRCDQALHLYPVVQADVSATGMIWCGLGILMYNMWADRPHKDES